MTEFEKRIPTKKKGEFIRFSIFFNKDNINWATSRKQDIGYRVSMVPIQRAEKNGYAIEESSAFSGYLDTLLLCTRRSKKRLETAIDTLENNLEKYINKFKERGYEFD